jgi:hypothetical protein
MNKLWETGKSTTTLILAHSFALSLPDPGIFNITAVKQTRKSGTHSNNHTLINPYSRGKPWSLIPFFCERNACRFYFRGLLFLPGEQMAGCTVF